MINVPRALDWQKLAVCDGARDDIFFPGEYELPDPAALAMCARCHVKSECLQYSIDLDIEYGIWGGLTEEQRRNITSGRHRVRCPDCRSDNVITEARYEVCLACGLSWNI